MVMRFVRSVLRKCLHRAFPLLKNLALRFANADITYRSNRISIKNTDDISILAFLGPYRNLTSFTSAVLALHPHVQVLNHSYNTVITKKTNFIKNASIASIDEFIRRAAVISSKRRVELFGRYIVGGSILDSHSFLDHSEVTQTYEARFGSELLKPSFQVLAWKESGRLTDYLMRYEEAFTNVLDHLPRIKFILPIRHPIDCAMSNFKLRYHQAPSFEGRPLYEHIPSDSLEGMLEFIVLSHTWCLRFAESYPDRFFVFSQRDVDDDLFSRLAKFLDIEEDDAWIRDCIKISKIKASYKHQEELIIRYTKLLDEYDVASISNHKFLTDWAAVH